MNTYLLDVMLVLIKECFVFSIPDKVSPTTTEAGVHCIVGIILALQTKISIDSNKTSI